MAVWKTTVDVSQVFQSDDLTLGQKTEHIVAQLKRFKDDGDIEYLREELTDAGQADDVNWWDQVWHAVYDWADAERVWIKTF